MDTKLNAIIEALRELPEREQISAWNEYQSETNGDREIFDMYEFDELNSGRTPSDVARSIFYGDFKPCHNFFTYNGYANFESFDFLADDNSPYSLDDLAEWVSENGCEYLEGDENLYSSFVNAYLGDLEINESVQAVLADVLEYPYSLITDDWDEIATAVRERLSE